MRDYLLTEEEDCFLRLLNILSSHKKRENYAVGLKAESKHRGMSYSVAIYDKKEAEFIKKESSITNILEAEEIIVETLKNLKAL